MQAQEWFKSQVKELENTPAFQAEALQIKITEKILELLQSRKMNKSVLAEKLNCSKPYITKLLNGGENLTIKKMAEIAFVLGCNLDIDFFPKEYKSQKFVLLQSNQIQPDNYNEPVEINEAEDDECCNFAHAV